MSHIVDIYRGSKKADNTIYRKGCNRFFIFVGSNISFYDIYEAPPKVSVKVATTTGDITIEGTTDSYAVVNILDAVLEDLRTPNTPENNEFPKYYKH